MLPTSTIAAVAATSRAPGEGGAATENFNIGWKILCNTKGLCEGFWAVFAAAPNTNYNPCGTPLYQDVTPFPGGANSPNFPANLGPFGAGGFTACNWAGGPTFGLAGVLRCSGKVAFTLCGEDKGERVQCNQNTWVPVAACEVG